MLICLSLFHSCRIQPQTTLLYTCRPIGIKRRNPLQHRNWYNGNFLKIARSNINICRSCNKTTRYRFWTHENGWFRTGEGLWKVCMKIRKNSSRNAFPVSLCKRSRNGQNSPAFFVLPMYITSILACTSCSVNSLPFYTRWSSSNSKTTVCNMGLKLGWDIECPCTCPPHLVTLDTCWRTLNEDAILDFLWVSTSYDMMSGCARYNGQTKKRLKQRAGQLTEILENLV